MATLTLIGEPFPDAEAAAHAEAARQLARAVADTAPRGCSARLLVAADRPVPRFDSARASVERLPLGSSVLPTLWRAGVTARPLDGEMVHATTPLAALRAHGEDDGSQSSVMVPHALGWLAPEAMGATAARQYRAFVKRAVKHADVVLTPTHATAAALQERYGSNLIVQVLPLAAPSSYLASDDAAERRAELGLPERYIATTAAPGEPGRLEWLFQAMVADPALPTLTVIAGAVPFERAGGTAGGAVHGAPPAAAAGVLASAAPMGGAEPLLADSPGAEAAASAAAASPGGGSEHMGTRTAEPQDEAVAAVLQVVPEQLRARVRVVHPRELADVGAVLSGAELLALPQSLIGTGFEVLGAIAGGVAVLHGGCPVVAELALDAGVATDSPERFASELSRLCGNPAERDRLGVLAHDRSRGFTWFGTAMSLWELHANI